MLVLNQPILLVKINIIMDITMDLIMDKEVEEAAAEVASEEILSLDKWQIIGWMSLAVMLLLILIANSKQLKMAKNKKSVNKNLLMEAAISASTKKDPSGLKTVLSLLASHLKTKKFLVN